MSRVSSALAPRCVAVIGGGPAGLMAAETLAAGGARVDLYDAMPSVGRKFLMAGRGGLNLTHSEPMAPFLARYGARRDDLAPWLARFDPQALRAWAHELGVATFVGTSGRVFPTDMKAAPLLRAWLHRLRGAQVQFHMRHRWIGWDTDDNPASAAGGNEGAIALRFAVPEGECTRHADAVVLALGGASWPRLGSDGAWVPRLAQRGVPVVPLRPANCGFDADWSDHFQARFAGAPLKTVALSVTALDGGVVARRGECVASATGLEGSLIYALSAPIRDLIAANGSAEVLMDLLPDVPQERVMREVSHPRGARSWSSHLQSRLGIAGVKAGLLRECLSRDAFADPARLARGIKALPIRLLRPRPIAEAISSAGGVALEALDAHLMIKHMPGVFCAGEMLDWEAPTGGYLLSACFASGVVAGEGVLAYLAAR
ncbi:MAG: TIGR03862 family flavoprotein [Burkholderiales bacterium]|nr:TIGR03862 family flavoprotein [Burkholderiales bacterium]